jgi:hypothetical protein
VEAVQQFCRSTGSKCTYLHSSLLFLHNSFQDGRTQHYKTYHSEQWQNWSENINKVVLMICRVRKLLEIQLWRRITFITVMLLMFITSETYPSLTQLFHVSLCLSFPRNT